MNEEIYSRTDDVLLKMLKRMEAKEDYSEEEVAKIIDNYVKLYELRQKDLETELKHDENRDKLAYENGRLDMELRAKEFSFETERDKLELEKEKLAFEKQKFETTAELERARAGSDKVVEWAKVGAAGLGLAFRIWLSSCLMHFDATGHVVGSFLGKKTLGAWVDRTEKLL